MFKEILPESTDEGKCKSFLVHSTSLDVVIFYEILLKMCFGKELLKKEGVATVRESQHSFQKERNCTR